MGTVARRARPGGGRTQTAADSISYEDLYRRWERGHWLATEIDFGVDAIHWREELSDEQRRAALWNYSFFLAGEDAVADGLSPYIDAAPREEQKYFLATQQVDEARHSIFFSRFMKEVTGVDGSTAGERLRAVDDQLTSGFREMLTRLERIHDELWRDPTPPRLAAGVTLYHIVLEAGLAQPGQHFFTRYLAETGLFPGLREGMEKVARDEQRHIGFGVKLLSDLSREDPQGIGEAVAGMLRDLLPFLLPVFVPPEFDRGYTECFGYSLEDVGEHAITSITTKLRSAGLPLESLPGPPLLLPGLTPRELAETAYRLVAEGTPGGSNGQGVA